MSAEMKVQPGDGAVRADEGVLVRIAIGFTVWAERWFPDAFIFVAIAVVVVVAGGARQRRRAARRSARRSATVSGA